MSPSIARNPTQFFAVVGAAYIPEHHFDSHRRYLTADDNRGLLGRALDLLNQFWNAGDHQRSASFH
jgi:hypothetical protein